ncbi:MAG: MOSC domain-containing protein [Gammaproteobacteria bacterium]|nr:MAG: MOSC domain-containing protein [Gammaproteobacteria bacterium]
MRGSIVSIHIASEEGGVLQPLDRAELVAGCGIRGDRHFSADGSRADEALTLIESEQVELFNELTGLSLAPHDTRRQIVTHGVPLNDLVGVRFRLGDVEVEGVELCEPCAYLADHLTKQFSITDIAAPEIVHGLAHRAGIRARILNDGTIRVGDPVACE